MTYIVEAVGIIAGIAYMIMGVMKYGLWDRISISGGFMPLICGGAITILCVLMLVSKVQKGVKASAFDKKALVPLGAMIAILLCSYIVGLIGACIAIGFLWLRFVEKFSWAKSILVSAVLFVSVYGIFGMWLNVPFPTGILGELF